MSSTGRLARSELIKMAIKWRRLKVNEIRDIYRRYWSQEDAHTIAISHKTTVNTVYRIGRGELHAAISGHNKPKLRRQRAKLPDNLVDLYARYSLDAIAIEYDVTRYLVRAELKRRGAKIKRVGRRTGPSRGAYGQIYESQQG